MTDISRYNEPQNAKGGRRSAKTVQRIRRRMRNGQIGYSERKMKEGERLDSIASIVYGDGRYWWVIAAASNIGWSMQVPPGTLLRVPNSLSEVL